MRPWDKQRFDELCCNLTGVGCGFKPEHAVSKKRLPTPSTGDLEGASKRQKTNSISDAQHGGSVSCTGKTNSVASLQNTATTCDQGILAYLGKCETVEGKQGGGTEKTDTSKDVLGTKENEAVKRSLNNSGEDLFEDGVALQTDTVNERTEQASLMERLKHVTGPLDIQSLIKDRTGYTCCLCEEDATAPFRAPCQHVCCFACWRDVFEKDKLCPGCGVRIRRRQLQGLKFSVPDT